ncbi:MAG: hypothetical protein ACXW1T_11150 [Methylophilus sp.]
MNSTVFEKINAALDSILDDYSEDHQVIFFTDAHRRAEQFNGIQQKFKDWNKIKNCIYQGCKCKSIKRSHTIQKSSSIASVSKNSTTLTPQFNHEIGEITLTPKGLAQASVFPGFCETHEALFAKFENTKKLEDEESLVLQIYRSICREVVRLRHEIKHLESTREKYQALRDKSLMEILRRKLGEEWLKTNDVKLSSISFKDDPMLEKITSSIDGLRTTLSQIESEHLREVEDAISGVQSDEINPVVISIDIMVPVALSGFGSFWVQDDGTLRQVFAVLGIYPFRDSNETVILLHGRAADTKFINGYLALHKNSFDILGMIEKFMIRGTDHWFLHPEVWDAKTQDERREILAEILDASKGLEEPVPYSIFDSIRQQMIETWETEANLTAQKMEVIAYERSKLHKATV